MGRKESNQTKNYQVSDTRKHFYDMLIVKFKPKIVAFDAWFTYILVFMIFYHSFLRELSYVVYPRQNRKGDESRSVS